MFVLYRLINMSTSNRTKVPLWLKVKQCKTLFLRKKKSYSIEKLTVSVKVINYRMFLVLHN